jgi:TAP-like protein
MKSPALHRNDRSRPMRPARRRQRAGRFRPTRRLTIRALAAGTLIAALAPVTAAAVLLIHEGYGHLSPSDPSACVNQALGRYLVDLSTPARGTTCPSDHMPFDPGFGQPAAAR